MILGLDSTADVCGWALLDERGQAFVDLGIVAAADRGELLEAKAADCTVVACQRRADRALSSFAARRDPPPVLLAVAPLTWQREVLLDPSPQPISAHDARLVAMCILSRHPRAYAAFDAIAVGLRVHALDAAMVALVSHLRPRRCERVPT